ncbi:UDP-glucose 4-epimerase GalE [Nanoarchaeota archaeon]
MKILVTGGAGYIGSVTVKMLLDEGHEVVVFDSLEKGHRKSVNCRFVKGNLGDISLLNETFEKGKFDAVIHFAAFIEAGTSMKNPSAYFKNNVVNGINLLDCMVKYGVKKIVFSSSAAVYKSKDSPIREDDPKEPENVYGETKLMFEDILKWYEKINGVSFVALRYFNASGACFGLGQDYKPETHLIPIILSAALGKRDSIKVFGTDYPTKDGACVRDFIHVKDLAKAHVLALNYNKSDAFNVGTGVGHSVKEVIETVREVTGKEIKVVETERRAGDPPVLVANSDKIRSELGWKPEFDLKGIIETAWEWHSNNPEGYNDQEDIEKST